MDFVSFLFNDFANIFVHFWKIEETKTLFEQNFIVNSCVHMFFFKESIYLH